MTFNSPKDESVRLADLQPCALPGAVADLVSRCPLMLFFYVIAMLLASCSVAAARHETLQDGISPNGRFHIVASQNAHKRISYDVELRASAVLHRFISTYQPEPDEAPDWAWDEAISAEVYWSPDSRYVAIDEPPYNHGGTVFLAAVRGDAVQTIAVPGAAMVAATHAHWDRYRTRVHAGWTSPHDLSLVLGGYAITEFLPDGRHVSYDRTFEICLHIAHGRAEVTSAHDITRPNEAMLRTAGRTAFSHLR